MTTAPQKAAALAALSDLTTMAPALKQSVHALALGTVGPHYAQIWTKPDLSGNQQPPAEVMAKLDAITAQLSNLTAIVTAVVPE